MHLPEQYADEFSIDHTKDGVETGDKVYYPPDGTVQTVVERGSDYVMLCEHGSGEEWVVDGSDHSSLANTHSNTVGP